MRNQAKKRFENYFYSDCQNTAPLMIAEISANHQSDLEAACALIRQAAQSGADAVKIQTYEPQTMTLDCRREGFVLKDSIWKGESLWDLYTKAHTPYSWHPKLFEQARQADIPILSTPFDRSAVELLESLQCPVYKIASFELCDHGLLKAVAETGKPIIVSTGMATLQEIHEAMAVLVRAKAKDVTVLHCISAYPTPLSSAKLEHIPFLDKEMNKYRSSMRVRIGLSDHTLGSESAIVATILGAQLIEKHFTLSRKDEGPDSAFSSEPDEFRSMVESCRNVRELAPKPLRVLEPRWLRCGSGEDSEGAMRRLRRSLYVVKPVKKGEVIEEGAVASLRPGLGLAPKYLEEVIGKRAARDLEWSRALCAEDICGFYET